MSATSKAKASSRPGGLAALHKNALKNLFGGVPRHSNNNNVKPSPPSAIGDFAHAEGDAIVTGRTSDIDSLQKELDGLKRLKAFLAGEVEQLRYGALHESTTATSNDTLTCTVADELEHVRARADYALGKDTSDDNNNAKMGRWAGRQYLHKYDDRDGIGLVASSNSVRASDNNNRKRRRSLDGDLDNAISEAINTTRKELETRNIAQMLHTLRTRRRIAAAHRLAGISVLPFRNGDDADNVLGIRLDICLDGEFVARYHVFFDVVMIRDEAPLDCDVDDDDDSSRSNNNKEECLRTVIRIAQHTLPTPGVSVQPILEEHFGPDGVLGIGPDAKDKPANEIIMSQIRRCVGDIYDACHSFTMRREACRYLRKKESSKYDNKHVRNVAHNDAYDRISFDCCLAKDVKDASIGKMNLMVQLCYDKQLIARPTSMRIKLTDTLEEDEPSAKLTEVIEEIKEAILSYPISVVLDEQIDLILRAASNLLPVT